MEEKAKIIDISTNPITNITTVTLEFKNRDIRKNIEKYRNRLLKVIITKFFEKRSLNANSYAWHLITELANVMRISKEEMYFLKLKDYGQSELVLITNKANPTKYFKYFSEEGCTKVKGKDYVWYKVYKGTSEYDRREMSIFIDGLVQDCKEQDIETKPKAEIESLLKEWDKNVNNRFVK